MGSVRTICSQQGKSFTQNNSNVTNKGTGEAANVDEVPEHIDVCEAGLSNSEPVIVLQNALLNTFLKNTNCTIEVSTFIKYTITFHFLV